MTTTDIAETGPGEVGVGAFGIGAFGIGGRGPGGLRVSRVPNSEPPPMDGGSISATPISETGTEVHARRRAPVPQAEPVDVELRRFAISATTVLLEVLGGRRPFAHLAEVAVPKIADQFRVLLATSQGRGPACTLLRLHTQHVSPDVSEITVVYRRGERVQAMGARVERRLMPIRPAAPGGPRRKALRCVVVSVSVG